MGVRERKIWKDREMYRKREKEREKTERGRRERKIDNEIFKREYGKRKRDRQTVRDRDRYRER